MRWFKFIIILAALAFAGFYIFASNMDETKSFTAQKELNYSVEKLFPQFNNLQNFTKWNTVFKGHKEYAIIFLPKPVEIHLFSRSLLRKIHQKKRQSLIF
jgi:hypothetical protein